LTLNGRLEKRTLLSAVGTAEKCQRKLGPSFAGCKIDQAQRAEHDERMPLQ
jgi:hypothetical protein